MRTRIGLLCLVCSALLIPRADADQANFKSSIQVSYRHGTEAQEEVNTPRLKKLAKITAQQAKRIARARFNEKIGRVDLENEDGNLIWSVEIGKHELAIDAGNGKILACE